MFNYEEKLQERAAKFEIIKGFENAIGNIENEIESIEASKESDPTKIIDNQIKVRELNDKIRLLEEEKNKVDTIVIDKNELRDYFTDINNKASKEYAQIEEDFLKEFDKLLDKAKTKIDKLEQNVYDKRIKAVEDFGVNTYTSTAANFSTYFIRREVEKRFNI
ncbi:MAG: hypothetical protein ACRDD7_08355 [Peptostreptococcaceae bacterium]